jgi:hypothetical protein
VVLQELTAVLLNQTGLLYHLSNDEGQR